MRSIFEALVGNTTTDREQRANSMAKKSSTWEDVKNFGNYTGDSESYIPSFQSFSGSSIIVETKYLLSNREEYIIQWRGPISRSTRRGFWSRRIGAGIKKTFLEYANHHYPQLRHNPYVLIDWAGGKTVFRAGYNVDDFPRRRKMFSHAQKSRTIKCFHVA